jgi:hypothetical protein
MQPVTVEVVAPVLTGFRHCPHCETFLDGACLGDQVHTQEINEYPEEIKADYLRLSEWVHAVQKTYGAQVIVRIIDPQSLGGFWKVLRHRIRRYPTFLIDGAERLVGWEANPDAALARLVGRPHPTAEPARS